jgi:hypothetical protein
MMAVQQLQETQLQWVRTGFGVGQETYELRADDAVLGAVRCRGVIISSAEAEAGDDHWTFEFNGILRNRLYVLRQTASRPVATYEASVVRGPLRGTVRLADGRRLYWLKERHWGLIWALTTDEGKPIAHFRQRVEQGAVVELAEAAQSEPELPLLLMLGFYLRRICIENEQAEAKREARRQQLKARQKPVLPTEPLHLK